MQGSWPTDLSRIQSGLLRDNGFWYDPESAFMVRGRPLKVIPIAWILTHSTDRLRTEIASAVPFHFRLSRADMAKWTAKYAWR